MHGLDVPQVTARSCPARLPPPGALRCGPACPTSPLSVCDGRWPGSVGKVLVHHAKPSPFGSLAHRAGGRSGASVALVRYGHPLRFYITPHCPQCPAVTALKLRFVPFTASRPSGEGNGTLCKVAYAIRRGSCAVAYVSCFASVPVGGPSAGHHDHEAGALRRPGAGAEFGKSAYIRRYIVKKQQNEKSPLLRCL